MILHGITSDLELKELANKLGIELDGVMTIEEAKAKIRRNGSYIILLHQGGGSGHWVAYDKGYYFDSFAEPPPRDLIRYVKSYNRKQVQGVYQEFCGEWCLLNLYSRQKHRPDLLKQMNDLNY